HYRPMATPPLLPTQPQRRALTKKAIRPPPLPVTGRAVRPHPRPATPLQKPLVPRKRVLTGQPLHRQYARSTLKPRISEPMPPVTDRLGRHTHGKYGAWQTSCALKQGQDALPGNKLPGRQKKHATSSWI